MVEFRPVSDLMNIQISEVKNVRICERNLAKLGEKKMKEYVEFLRNWWDWWKLIFSIWLDKKSVSGRDDLFFIILQREKVGNKIWVIECRVLTWSQTWRWGRSCSLDRESRSSWRSGPRVGVDGEDSAGFAGKRSSSSPQIIFTAEVFFGQIPA